jgi:ADP-ribose pyrophosphatase YjhB (NUDIX family)
MTANVQDTPSRYRDEPMRYAASPDVGFEVQIRHADSETFADAVAWNKTVKGMAGVAARNDAGEMLFIDHEDYGGWTTPGGRVDDGESYREGAARECCEESGVEVEIVRPLAVFQFVNRYDGNSTDTYFVLFEGEAVDAEPAEDPGIGDESITAVEWTDTVPDRLPDDEFVQRTIRLAVEQFEAVDWE